MRLNKPSPPHNSDLNKEVLHCSFVSQWLKMHRCSCRGEMLHCVTRAQQLGTIYDETILEGWGEPRHWMSACALDRIGGKL